MGNFLIASQALTIVFAATAAYMAYMGCSGQQQHLKPEIEEKTTSGNSAEEWLTLVEAADQEDKAFRLLEAAHQRFPSNEDVVERLTDHYREEASASGNLAVCREATLGFQRVAGRFKDNCPPESFDLGRADKWKVRLTPTGATPLPKRGATLPGNSGRFSRSGLPLVDSV
jgi:hypothetical protein